MRYAVNHQQMRYARSRGSTSTATATQPRSRARCSCPSSKHNHAHNTQHTTHTKYDGDVIAYSYSSGQPRVNPPPDAHYTQHTRLYNYSYSSLAAGGHSRQLTRSPSTSTREPFIRINNRKTCYSKSPATAILEEGAPPATATQPRSRAHCPCPSTVVVSHTAAPAVCNVRASAGPLATVPAAATRVNPGRCGAARRPAYDQSAGRSRASRRTVKKGGLGSQRPGRGPGP